MYRFVNVRSRRIAFLHLLCNSGRLYLFQPWTLWTGGWRYFEWCIVEIGRVLIKSGGFRGHSSYLCIFFDICVLVIALFVIIRLKRPFQVILPACEWWQTGNVVMAESLNRNWELKSKIDEGVSKKFSWEPEKLTRGENLIKFETKKNTFRGTQYRHNKNPICPRWSWLLPPPWS